jgi:hypothetical protein
MKQWHIEGKPSAIVRPDNHRGTYLQCAMRGTKEESDIGQMLKKIERLDVVDLLSGCSS